MGRQLTQPAPAVTATSIGSLINSATDKPTPVDADTLALSDSAASNILKKLSWANVKATLTTYFNGLYATIGDLANYAPISFANGFQYGVKTSDEDKTSNDTLGADGQITATVPNAAFWDFVIKGWVNCGAVGGLKLAVTSGGAPDSIKAEFKVYNETAQTLAAVVRKTAIDDGVSVAGAAVYYFEITGTIETTGSAVVALAWAQAVSNGTATTLLKDSSIMTRKAGEV